MVNVFNVTMLNLYSFSVETEMADNFLSYRTAVTELFHTTDGNDLNADCTRLYNIEAATKTSSMREHISAALVSSACGEVVTSVTHAQSFTGLGNQVGSHILSLIPWAIVLIIRVT